MINTKNSFFPLSFPFCHKTLRLSLAWSLIAPSLALVSLLIIPAPVGKLTVRHKLSLPHKLLLKTSKIQGQEFSMLVKVPTSYAAVLQFASCYSRHWEAASMRIRDLPFTWKSCIKQVPNSWLWLAQFPYFWHLANEPTADKALCFSLSSSLPFFNSSLPFCLLTETCNTMVIFLKTLPGCIYGVQVYKWIKQVRHEIRISFKS